MDSMTLNDDGTVDVVLDADTAVHLPRPKIRQYRDLSEAMEQADATWRELVKADWPEIVLEQATALALADLGEPSGSAATRAKHNADLRARTISYGDQINTQRLIQSAASPYAKVWMRVLSELGGLDRAEDDLPAWMANYMSLAALSGHWIAVPLRLGPTTGQPDDDSQTTPTT